MTSKIAAAGLALAVLAALVFLYVTMRPEQPPATPASMPAAYPPTPRVIEIVVKDGRRLAGPDRIELRQHDTVTLKVSSDRADELHLHGYDLHLHLHPGEPAELTFPAVHTGRFEYELHKSHLLLGTLEVLPR